MPNILKDAELLVQYVNTIKKAAGQYLTIPTEITPPNVGLFTSEFPEWKPNSQYKKGDLFSYFGSTGYVKQPQLTSQDIYPPFSKGTEALYGARPKPNNEGIYPYIYNMGLYKGMLVEDQGVIYESLTGTYENPTELLYNPKDVPAMLKVYDNSIPSPDQPTDSYPEWKQPTGAFDAYNIGDKVTYQGRKYESLIAANTTIPGTDDRFWKEI